MHLDPGRESHIAELFRAATEIDVVQVSEAQVLVPDRVYVIAPNSSLEVHKGVLNPKKPHDPHGKRKPVDALFSSMAEDLGELAVAIVLSGTGNNGSAGIQDVMARGGFCLAQSPDSAEYDGMPRSAIETGAVDRVLAPEEMPRVVMEYAEHPGSRTDDEQDAQQAEPTSAFGGILGLLSQLYGVNFRTSYKRGTLQRRAERRMGLKQISQWPEYLQILESDPKEVAALYADLLIGVTEFFRDPHVWQKLEAEVIPSLLEQHDEGLPVKIWVPGCATGEEAYSLAIAFLEQREQLGRRTRIHVFASDVAEDAVAFARRGVYSSAIQDQVAPERISRFFRRVGEQLEVSHEVRDMVTFAVHNLLADPPFSQLDLLSCRNVLIYLESHAQHRIMELFHFALKPGGRLILGASETVGRYGNLFEPVSDKARIYLRAATVEGLRHRHLPGGAQQAPFLATGIHAPSVKGPKVSRALELLVLSRYTQACVAVTESFEIRAFFGPTHDYLLQPTGEARMDLLAWAKPGLYPRLRNALERAREHNEQVNLTGMRIERGDTTARVEITIDPVSSLPGHARMFLVSFRDVPLAPAAELEYAAESDSKTLIVCQLEAELKSTRAELRDVVEQLESTNDEYQASTEELLSLNEELQSSNEELEASKEELQSLNEEMSTINRQLEEKHTELRTTYDDLTNLVTSTDIPIIFLDRALRVRRFTPAATRLMRLAPSDVGRSIEHIKERFNSGGGAEDAHTVLEKLAPIKAEVQTEDGHWYSREVLPYRTEDDRIGGVCVAFHDVTERKRAAQEIDEGRIYAEAIVHTVRTPLVVLNGDLSIVSANAAFHQWLGTTSQEVEGKGLFDLGRRRWNVPRLRTLLEEVLPARQEVFDYEFEQDMGSMGRRTLRLNARLMSREARPNLILLALEDVTKQKEAERIVLERADELVDESRRKDQFLAMLGHELRNPLSALTHGLYLLGFGTDDATRVEKIRQMMTRQAKRIGGMLNQLLDVARLTAGKVRIAQSPVDVAETVRTGVEAVSPLIEERKQKLVTQIPPGQSIVVLGDAGRLTQVVENLINNAAKYTEEGGEIEVSLEPQADQVLIRVRDNGIGMDADLLPRIFELFIQDDRALDRAGGGLGLGLPLVKSVVELHGGRVDAKSKGSGQGSEFVVSLPRMLDRRAQERGDGSASGDDSAERRPNRILVVDDEEDSATMLAETLAMHGHETRAAHDGPAALEMARSFQPDIVLLDLGLPKMDGYEVAKQLRDEHGERHLLVALTGYQQDAERLTQAGFDRHLIKPPDMAKLFQWLAESRISAS